MCQLVLCQFIHLKSFQEKGIPTEKIPPPDCSGEAIDEDKSSEAVKCPEINGSWRKAEACNLSVGSQSQERAQESLIFMVYPVAMGTPVSWDHHQGDQQQQSGPFLSLGDQLCIIWLADPLKYD